MKALYARILPGRGNGDEILPQCGQLRQKVYQVIIFCIYGVKERLGTVSRHQNLSSSMWLSLSIEDDERHLPQVRTGSVLTRAWEFYL